MHARTRIRTHNPELFLSRSLIRIVCHSRSGHYIIGLMNSEETLLCYLDAEQVAE